jgi:hypothetical protein
MPRKIRSIVFGESTRLIPGPACPACHEVIDGAFAVSGGYTDHTPAEAAAVERSKPYAGALTICGRCGEILQYTLALDLQRAHLLSLDPELVSFAQRMQRAIREARLEVS